MSATLSILGAEQSSATLSPCRLYRYTLTRRWGTGSPMLFVMLNPSTADAFEDDPTIRRCVGFAKREHFNAIEVVNLFAFRATNPEDLTRAIDPVGPENDAAIYAAQLRAGIHVVAWGASVPKNATGRVREVCALLGPGALCLGVTKGGAPRHPLYLPANAPLVGFP